mmetsp:Transcript_64369/g.140126  ORF Transcript_64369/g.140126 Transcript_64369/m.140126 type:complete len:346 (+) Transcript_64369:60-1097(+)
MPTVRYSAITSLILANHLAMMSAWLNDANDRSLGGLRGYMSPPLRDGGIHDCISAPNGEAIGMLHHFADLEDTRYNHHGAHRCYRLFAPPVDNTVPFKPMPVIIYFHEMLDRAVHACQENSTLDLARQAQARGFALVCADANVHWDIPESNHGQDGICNDEASEDHRYVRHILDSIKSRGKFDHDRIYFVGHSEGAAFTTWASFCFASEIRGFGASGYGLKLHGAAVEQSHCDKLTGLGYDCQVGKDDGIQVPGGYGACDGCEYSPLKPWKVRNVVGQDLRICLFNGREDYFRPSTWAMEAMLKSLNMPYESIEFEGIHMVPDGFGELLSTCLIDESDITNVDTD